MAKWLLDVIWDSKEVMWSDGVYSLVKKGLGEREVREAGDVARAQSFQ